MDDLTNIHPESPDLNLKLKCYLNPMILSIVSISFYLIVHSIYFDFSCFDFLISTFFLGRSTTLSILLDLIFPKTKKVLKPAQSIQAIVFLLLPVVFGIEETDQLVDQSLLPFFVLHIAVCIVTDFIVNDLSSEQ